MYIRLIFISFLFLSLFSCKEYTPKPKGYPRIEKNGDSTLTYTCQLFSFQYPSSAIIEDAKSDKEPEKWLNIRYPRYKTTIYCSYIPINKDLFSKALEDSHRIAYSHASQASGIKQTRFSDPEHDTSGLIYDITGNIASPIQFFLTDSVHHFFRGSLYYDEKVNMDSVASLTSSLREDILNIMQSMEWIDNASR